MTAPQAQTKLSEVLTYVENYNGRIALKNFRYSKWLREAQVLIKSNPLEGYAMEALAHRAYGNVKKSLVAMEKAFRINSNIAGISYCNILIRNGKFDECHQTCLDILKKDPVNSVIFSQMLVNTLNTLDDNGLQKGIEMFKSQDKNGRDLIDTAMENIETIADLKKEFEAVGASIENYQWLMSISTQVCAKKYIGNSQVSFQLERTEIGEYIRVTEKLSNVSIDDCLELNDDLLDAMIEENYPFDDYQKILFNFEPLPEGEKADIHSLIGI